MFRLITSASIADVESWKTYIADSSDKKFISSDTEKTVVTKTKAMEQTLGYKDPFLVTLMRSLVEKGRFPPSDTVRRDSDGTLVYGVSRTGVSKATYTEYGVKTLKPGYTVNAIVRLGDGETADAYMLRVRDMIAIMLK